MFFRIAISGGFFALMFILFFGIIITQNLDLGSSFISFLGGGMAMGATLIITKHVKTDDFDLYLYGEKPEAVKEIEKVEDKKKMLPISKQLIEAVENPPKPKKELKKEDLSELEIEHLTERNKRLSEIDKKIKDLDKVAEEYKEELSKTTPNILAQKEREYEEKLEKIEELKEKKNKEEDKEDKPKYTIHETKI